MSPEHRRQGQSDFRMNGSNSYEGVPECPYCGGQGWYVVPNRNTGDAEQEQCQWCAEHQPPATSGRPQG